jgi:hypothetical protein
MKPRFYLFAFAIINAFSARASSFSIHFNRAADFMISIDGYDYNVSGNDFYIPSIRAGEHNLIISSLPRSRGYRNPMPVVLYRGSILIQPRASVNSIYDQYGFHIDQPGSGFQKENKRAQYDNRKGGRRDQDPYENYESFNNGDHRYNRDENRYMDNRDFEMLKQNIRGASFESTKKTIEEAGISNNRISLQQTKELLMLLDFESTKLEVARYAFDRSPDQQNFYFICDAFTFDSSKREVAGWARR